MPEHRQVRMSADDHGHRRWAGRTRGGESGTFEWRVGIDDAERTELITGGLFRWVRRPVFTGMAAVSAEVAMMTPTKKRRSIDSIMASTTATKLRQRNFRVFGPAFR